jgi:hypothetical protein
MREQINNNPLVQVGLIAVLLLGAAFFVMSSMGGGSKEGESEAGSATVQTAVANAESELEPAASVASALASVNKSSAATPPLPADVMSAWHANRTLALLFVHDGGIEDRQMKKSVAALSSQPNVATFVVPAHRISRYAAITEGVGVDRVPALVVVRPKHLKRSVPTASVTYGFQSVESAVQDVIDAEYKGHSIDYHP